MLKHEPPDILSLISACRVGDRKAQQRLYQWLYQKMLNIGMRYANDRMEAEAILNQACLKIFQSLSNYDQQQSFYTWTKKIVLYTAIDHLRKTTAYRKRVSPQEIHADDAYILNDALNKLGTEDIFHAIQQLPRSMRAVFCLYEIDGFQHREIAAQLHISESTSRWHLNAAKKRLRSMLAPIINQPHC